MKKISGASVQRDSQRDVTVETDASDSDSGDSFFLTQSVTPVSRTVKRCRPSDTQTCPFSQLSADEQETVQHGDIIATSDSVSETSFTDLFRRWRSPERTRGRISCRRRLRHRRVPLKTLVFPSLKKSDSRQLSVRENNTIVNSEIGGFFKCIQKLSKGHSEESRRELSPSMLPAEWEQNHTEESNKDDEDVRKVNLDCFIFGARNRGRQARQLYPKQKMRQEPKKCAKKNKKCQEEQGQSCQTRNVAEGLIELQDSTDIHNESSLSSKEKSLSKKRGKKSRKSSTMSSLSTCSTPSHRSSEKYISIFNDPVEKHTKTQPQVLVQCSQSQSLDWHQTQKNDQAQKNLKKPIDDLRQVEETQCQSSADQDEDETQILEINNTNKSRGEDALYMENISSCKRQVQVRYIRGDQHNEPVETEDFDGVSEDFPTSQDLFLEPNIQTSPSKTTGVNSAELLADSHVVFYDIINKKNKKRSINFADVKGDYVKYAKSQKSQSSEMSPSAEEIDQEKHKKTSEDTNAEHVHPSISESHMALRDIMNNRGLLILADVEGDHAKTLNSQVTQTSKIISPISGELEQAKEEKMESTLFNYGGMTFLKRKKGKETNAPGSGDVDTIKQRSRKVKNYGLLENPVDTFPEIHVNGKISQGCSVVFQSLGGTESKKERKEDTGGEFLEEPVDTLHEISCPTDSISSFQDCTSVRVNKLKNNRKRDNNDGLLVEPDDRLHEISVSAESVLSAQDSSVDCAGVGKIKRKEKRKRDKNDELLAESVNALQEKSVSADITLSVQDSLLDCATVGGSNMQTHGDLVQPNGLEPRRKKKKKTKKRDSSPDRMVASQCKEEISISPNTVLSVQNPSVDCASVGGSKSKKKRKKEKNGGLLEEPVNKLPEVSAPADSFQPVQDILVDCASVGGKKKKRKKDGLLAEPVETRISAHSTLSVQGSSVNCDGVGKIKRKDKRKKGKNDELLAESVDALQEKSVSADITLSVQDSLLNCAIFGGSNMQAHEDLVQPNGLEPGRKKKKKTKKRDSSPDRMVASQCKEEISISPNTVLSVQNPSVDCASVGGSKSKKKRKKEKNGGLLEEPVNKLPEVSAPADSFQPVQDILVDCASVGGKKKKRKKDGLLAEPVETRISAHSTLSVQGSSVNCDGVGKIKRKDKRKKGKNDELLAESVDALQEKSVSADITLSVQDSLLNCAIFGGSNMQAHEDLVQPNGLEPGRKKKKKTKKRDSSPDRMVASQCKEEISISPNTVLSVQNPSVDCASVGGSKSKKKRKKEKNGGLLEEPVNKLPEVSAPADSFQPVQDILVDCASVGGKKKKRKKDGLLAEPVETRISAHSTLSVQGSSVNCDGVGKIKRKDKRKKGKNDELLAESVDALQEKSVSADITLSVQDSLLNCAIFGGSNMQAHEDLVQPNGLEPGRKKKKKTKKRDSSPDRMFASQCKEEISISPDSVLSVQGSSVNCASVGESKPRKKDNNGELAPTNGQLIVVEEDIQIRCKGSSSLLSTAVETKQLTGNDFSSPEVNQLDLHTQVHEDHAQDDGVEPRRKQKKKAKKRDLNFERADEMVAFQCSEESHPRPCTKTVKKKKQRFKVDVGEENAKARKCLEEPFDKTLEIPAGIKIQLVNNIDFLADESVTPWKKEKK